MTEWIPTLALMALVAAAVLGSIRRWAQRKRVLLEIGDAWGPLAAALRAAGTGEAIAGAGLTTREAEQWQRSWDDFERTLAGAPEARDAVILLFRERP